jgi:hypothetical protein
MFTNSPKGLGRDFFLYCGMFFLAVAGILSVCRFSFRVNLYTRLYLAGKQSWTFVLSKDYKPLPEDIERYQFGQIGVLTEKKKIVATVNKSGFISPYQEPPASEFALLMRFHRVEVLTWKFTHAGLDCASGLGLAFLLAYCSSRLFVSRQ